MPYQPIEDYGIIGNMRTVALVGVNGSIDWFCYPHIDSPSVFGAILDDNKGGRFTIAPTTNDVTRKQLYWPETNVPVTRFLSSDGVGEVRDFMPLEGSTNGSRGSRVVRLVTTHRGSMTFRMECHPAFNYARDTHETEIAGGGVGFHSPGLSLGLATGVKLERDRNGVVA